MSSSKTFKHIPVLLEEVLTYLAGHSLLNFFEGTLGLGGHAEAILQAHPEIRRYVALDQDKMAIEIAKERLKAFSDRIDFHQMNFSQIDRISEENGPMAFDGALLDIGVSSLQLDEQDRGFSLRKEGPLDMRMDQSQSISAKDIVNGYSEKQLQTMLKEFGEVRFYRPLAKLIVEERKKRSIETTTDLTRIVEKLFPKQLGKIHPATQVFQAVRIAVNRELDVLKEGLKKIAALLNPGGLFLVITFHSLEDRIVKEEFKTLSAPTKNERGQVVALSSYEIVTKKPVQPSLKEVRQNARSRSAKLRIIKRIIEN